MKKIKLTKEEDKDQKTLVKEYKRLEIFITVFMAIAICLGTFYFNVICFGSECENKSPTPLIIIKTPGSTTDVEKTGEDTAVSALTNEEAVAVVKELFNNSVVRWMFDDNGSIFCKTESESLSARELGLNRENDRYQKCLDYNSYDEITNKIKRYFTDEYYGTLLKSRPFLAYSSASTDGTTMYNYYEKNGNLYAIVTYKGSNLNKASELNDDNTYEITKIAENEISAKVNAKWLDVDNNNYVENIKLSLQKEDGKWKINSYEVTSN